MITPPRLSPTNVILIAKPRRRTNQLATRVLMVSSEDQAGLMAQALADGASSFLRKPVAADLLLRAVRRLVGSSADREGPH